MSPGLAGGPFTTSATWEAQRTYSLSEQSDCTEAMDCVDHDKLREILKEMGKPDHLICLLRNLYAGQEATVRTGHGTTDWFKVGKGVTLRLYIVNLFT